jgi:hypothetical protein
MIASLQPIKIDLKKELHNEFYNVFVCQICKEVPKQGPIYTCNTGDHATCNDCFQTSKVCKCKADIKYRNKALEKIRTSLPLSCKFRKNGCSSVLTLESLLFHEVDCEWRQIFCPVLGCSSNESDGDKILFNLLDNHLTEHHPELVNYLNESFIEDNLEDVMEGNLV